MELVDGRPLDALLQAQGRMPHERVLAIGHQLAAALAYAHRNGVLPRDIRPSNILLSADGGTATASSVERFPAGASTGATAPIDVQTRSPESLNAMGADEFAPPCLRSRCRSKTWRAKPSKDGFVESTVKSICAVVRSSILLCRSADPVGRIDLAARSAARSTKARSNHTAPCLPRPRHGRGDRADLGRCNSAIPTRRGCRSGWHWRSAGSR